MMKVTHRTKGILKGWFIAYGCCVVLALLCPWVTLSFMISFIVLTGSMIVAFGMKQSSLIAHVQQHHPDKWAEIDAESWGRGVRKFYRDSEYFDDPTLKELKLDYQSVESWWPWLPMGAVITVILLSLLSGKM